MMTTEVFNSRIRTTSTALATTTGAPMLPDLYMCIFQDSSSCSLSERTVCAIMAPSKCTVLSTTPYNMYGMVETAGTGKFVSKLYLDASCSSVLLGAFEESTSTINDCVAIKAAKVGGCKIHVVFSHSSRVLLVSSNYGLRFD